MASVKTHAVVESFLALSGAFVSGISEPAVRLKQNCRSKILVTVPPV